MNTAPQQQMSVSSVTFSNHLIAFSDFVLGMYLDDQLSLKVHISPLCKVLFFPV